MGSNIDFWHEQNTPFPGVTLIMNTSCAMLNFDLTDGSFENFQSFDDIIAVNLEAFCEKNPFHADTPQYWYTPALDRLLWIDGQDSPS